MKDIVQSFTQSTNLYLNYRPRSVAEMIKQPREPVENYGICDKDSRDVGDALHNVRDIREKFGL